MHDQLRLRCHKGRDENGSETDRNQLYHIRFYFFGIGIRIRIENLDTEMKLNIIEYRYGANTRRNEYGSEYLPVYKKIPQIEFLDKGRDIAYYFSSTSLTFISSIL